MENVPLGGEQFEQGRVICLRKGPYLQIDDPSETIHTLSCRMSIVSAQGSLYLQTWERGPKPSHHSQLFDNEGPDCGPSRIG